MLIQAHPVVAGILPRRVTLPVVIQGTFPRTIKFHMYVNNTKQKL